MTSTALSAINAYKNSIKLPLATKQTEEFTITPFKDFLSDTKVNNSTVIDKISSAFDTIKISENVTKAAVVGKADTIDVSMALNEAEIALQTMMSIRDKLISAWQDITKMPI